LDGPAPNSDILGRIRSYIRIAGCVGKHCDLEDFQSTFQQAFPDAKVSSVSGLIVDFIAPFAQPKYPRELRLMALESLGSVCQSWPAQYGRERARSALSAAFDEDARDLQNIVLKAFLEFFSIHEGKSEKVIDTGDAAGSGHSSRLGGSLRASDNDGAAALIAQNFLSHMLRAAVSGQDSYALTAIELIASINRQGLIHPKECAGVLIALETSTNSAIAKTAFETHKMLHQQHESMFDREYMRAVQEAFYYQRDVVGDTTGALYRPFSSKLAPLFEVIKTSSSKYQKKFLTNLCSKANFDLKKLDTRGDPPEHLLFARFVSHNLAFFEYGQIAELITTVGCLERIVGETGSMLAHAIDTELFPAKEEPEAVNGLSVDGTGVPVESVPQKFDTNTLKRLSVGAAVLLMLWETRTYLRRLYGLHSHSRQKEGKANAKELNKAPTKVQGMGGDRYWDAIAKLTDSVTSTETMIDVCKHFATLMSIDDELKVAADNDHDSGNSAGEIDDMGGPLPAMNGTKPTKRKSSVSGGGTPKKSKKERAKRQSLGAEDDAAFE
jgi:cohesin loading factor subunit SCC2